MNCSQQQSGLLLEALREKSKEEREVCLYVVVSLQS